MRALLIVALEVLSEEIGECVTHRRREPGIAASVRDSSSSDAAQERQGGRFRGSLHSNATSAGGNPANRSES